MQGQTCVTRLTRALMPFAERVEVTLEPPRAVLRNPDKDASLDVLQIAVAGAGKYEIEWDANGFYSPFAQGDGDSGWMATIKPPLLLFAFLLGVTLLLHARAPGRPWHEWLVDFLGGAFLILSFFKLVNLSAFVDTFRAYDLVAARMRAYAVAYPLLELALGVAYVARWNLNVTHWIALATIVLSTLGVFSALRKRRLLESAWLGTVLKLPLSKHTLAAHLLMAAMASVLLLGVE